MSAIACYYLFSFARRRVLRSRQEEKSLHQAVSHVHSRTNLHILHPFTMSTNHGQTCLALKNQPNKPHQRPVLDPEPTWVPASDSSHTPPFPTWLPCFEPTLTQVRSHSHRKIDSNILWLEVNHYSYDAAETLTSQAPDR
jgi:hypothetical protein